MTMVVVGVCAGFRSKRTPTRSAAKEWTPRGQSPASTTATSTTSARGTAGSGLRQTRRATWTRGGRASLPARSPMRPRVLTHEYVAVRETLKPWPKQLPLPTTPALHVSLDTGNIVAGDILMPDSQPRAPDHGRYGLRFRVIAVLSSDRKSTRLNSSH